MDAHGLVIWGLVALVGVMTPGLDTLLVLRHTVSGGRAAGAATVAGVCLGYLVWATASLAGLTALMTASRVAYDVLRVAGAVYLIWLGVNALRASLRCAQDEATLLETTERTMSPWAAMRTGAFTNLLNPKVGVFYLSILPQFLPTGPDSVAWGALLVVVHVGVTCAWFALLIWVASRARNVLMKERARAWMERLSGGIFIGLGVKLAIDAR